MEKKQAKVIKSLPLIRLWLILLLIVSCNRNDKKINSDLRIIEQLRNDIFQIRGAYARMNFEIREEGVVYLELYGGEGAELHQSIFNISNLKNIEIIKINRLSIEEAPPIDSLKELRHLDLAYNKIAQIKFNKIPPFLKSVDLNSNQIILFKFGVESNITELGLANNRISFIDSSIKNLEKLKSLNIAGNQIQDIDLTGLPNLELVFCKGNPIQDTLKIIKRHIGQKTKFIF